MKLPRLRAAQCIGVAMVAGIFVGPGFRTSHHPAVYVSAVALAVVSRRMIESLIVPLLFTTLVAENATLRRGLRARTV